jgi:hypothetical protein
MLREKLLTGLLCFSVLSTACQSPPDNGDETIGEPGPAPNAEPGGSNAEPGTEDPELVAQAVTAPKDAPFGSLGGVCGVNWSKCQTQAQQESVFKKLKKTLGKVKHTYPTESDPTGPETITFNVTVPKLVNDHKDKNDVLGITETKSVRASGDRVLYSFSLVRNGTPVYVYRTEIREDGSNNHEQKSVDIRKGGVESFAAITIDPKILGQLKTARQDLSKFPRTVCRGIGLLECLGCHGLKFSVLVGSTLIGVGLGAAGGPMGAALGATLGATIGAAVASQIDCGPECGRKKCNDHYCSCITARGQQYGNSPACSMMLDSCCDSVSASWCERNSQGCHTCM